MDVSEQSIVDRIARVLAAQRASVNADGDASPAADIVDASWRNHIDDALAVLKTMREPDQVMARAGSPEIWEAMILAALRDRERSSPSMI
jgi:hypothetical protein